MRRHPRGNRLFHAFPSGHQYDLLWIVGDSGLDLRLNRNGTIRVDRRGDGVEQIDWEPTAWEDYLAANPRQFLERFERAAGLKAPAKVPQSTPETLTYRVLAAISASAVKTVRPFEIQLGFIDSSGDGSERNYRLDEFDLPSELTERRDDDFYGEPGYRFWIVVREDPSLMEDQSLMVLEQSSATAWFRGSSSPVDLMDEYRKQHKEPSLVAATVIGRALSSK